MKTPEEYFQDHIELPESGEERPYTRSEQDFLRKYLGVEQDEILRKLNLHPPEMPTSQATTQAAPQDAPPSPAVVQEPAKVAPRPEAVVPSQSAEPEKERPAQPRPAGPAPAADTRIESETLQQEEVLQLVSFFLGNQEYVVPISHVQEVIRRMEPVKIPAAPRFMAGIINLRGRVTPLVHLGMILNPSDHEPDDEGFVIICKTADFQIGLLVTRVASMYRVTQDLIEWNIDSNLGVASDLLVGLIKQGERLIGIVDVSSLVQRILRQNGEGNG